MMLDFALADVSQDNDRCIVKMPLSPDGSTQYVKDLDRVMKMLLNHVKIDGHLETYWSQIQKENEKARRAAWKVKIDREKIAEASAYNSDNETKFDTTSDEESDWSVEGSPSSDESEVPEDVVSFGKQVEPMSPIMTKNDSSVGELTPSASGNYL